jgi:hypothetical protein
VRRRVVRRRVVRKRVVRYLLIIIYLQNYISSYREVSIDILYNSIKRSYRYIYTRLEIITIV